MRLGRRALVLTVILVAGAAPSAAVARPSPHVITRSTAPQSSTSTPALPYTGFGTGLEALAGGALVLTGLRLRVRSRPPRRRRPPR